MTPDPDLDLDHDHDLDLEALIYMCCVPGDISGTVYVVAPNGKLLQTLNHAQQPARGRYHIQCSYQLQAFSNPDSNLIM